MCVCMHLLNSCNNKVLETVCEIIDMRHPPEIARVARPLCEDILDEFDNEVCLSVDID